MVLRSTAKQHEMGLLAVIIMCSISCTLTDEDFEPEIAPSGDVISMEGSGISAMLLGQGSINHPKSSRPAKIMTPQMVSSNSFSHPTQVVRSPKRMASNANWDMRSIQSKAQDVANTVVGAQHHAMQVRKLYQAPGAQITIKDLVSASRYSRAAIAVQQAKKYAEALALKHLSHGSITGQIFREAFIDAVRQAQAWYVGAAHLDASVDLSEDEASNSMVDRQEGQPRQKPNSHQARGSSDGETATGPIQLLASHSPPSGTQVPTKGQLGTDEGLEAMIFHMKRLRAGLREANDANMLLQKQLKKQAALVEEEVQLRKALSISKSTIAGLKNTNKNFQRQLFRATSELTVAKSALSDIAGD